LHAQKAILAELMAKPETQAERHVRGETMAEMVR